MDDRPQSPWPLICCGNAGGPVSDAISVVVVGILGLVVGAAVFVALLLVMSVVNQ